MNLVAAALLLASLAALAWFTQADIADYAAFKQLTDTAERQRHYRGWVLKAFAIFVGGSLVCLAILHDLGCVIHEPQVFFSLARLVRAELHVDEIGPEFLGGLVGAAVTVGVLVTVLTAIRARPGETPPAAPVIGDIQSLMPRNGAETCWAALLSINAGVSEELFFRLLLPLLVTLVTGNAMIGFAAASIVFGLVHLYQGWIGVLATAFLGLAFSAIYLWSGSLAVPMALHAGLDLIGLVVRPTIARLLTRR